jgi:hypothetical protein
MTQHVRSQVVILAVGLSAVLALASCGGDDDAPDTPTPDARTSSPATTATSAPTTVTPLPEDEVLDAYATYWEVYAAALRDRDSSHLAEVMTGPRLDRALTEVETLKTQGQAVQIVVNSRPVIVSIEGDRALVMDEYENQSHLIDPTSKQPLQPTPAPGPTLRDRVTLQRSDSGWKVLETVRQEAQ